MVKCVCDHAQCAEQKKENGYCYVSSGGACFSSINSLGEKSRGCLTEAFKNLQCGFRHPGVAIKCCEKELCNNIALADLPPKEPFFSLQQSTYLKTVSICAAGIASAVVLIFGLKKFYDFIQKRTRSVWYSSGGYSQGGLMTSMDEPGTTSTGVEDTSGSGKGYANLEARTIAKDAKYIGDHPIGKGRYGEVWKARWKGKIVAIKEFPSTDGESFARESRIYTSLMLRHPNILTFYATDCKSVFMKDEGTKLLLITAYHKYGSLFEFLQMEKISLPLALRILQTAINGISHLHSGIVSTSELDDDKLVKVSIAHRDIKSRNILVKENLECCIADFGLAVKQGKGGEVDFVSERKDFTPNPRVGTRRYMAPEILSQSIEMRDFSAFLCADVYAIGLFVWEVTNVIQDNINDEKAFYAPPFGGKVSADPSFDEMEKVVCMYKQRPYQKDEWEFCRVKKILAKIQRECWAEIPSARLPIMRVKKLLKECQDMIENDYEDYDQHIEQLVESVSESYKTREETRKLEEIRIKDEQDELNRKRNEELYHMPFMRSQYSLPHSPIPHFPEWNPNFYLSGPHNPYAKLYTSTPMNQNVHQQNHNYQNANFHCKFR